MVGLGSHQAESIASQCENPFANLERRSDQEGSVHATHTIMLISSLNLILTRTNLTFTKTFPKASLFHFRIIFLFLFFFIYNLLLDIQSIFTVLKD